MATYYESVTATSSTTSGPSEPGAVISLTVAATGTLSVNTTKGRPTLQLNDGAIATYTGVNGSNLEFQTTILNGQNAADLFVTGISLNGGIITDAQGNLVTDTIGVISAGVDTSIVIGASPPAAPSSLTLEPLYDSGIVGDHITNRTTLILDGTAEPGSKVTLTDTSTGTIINFTQDGFNQFVNGTFSILTNAAILSDGIHVITATATDASGDVSAPSTAYTLTVDTVAPTVVAVSANPSSVGPLGTGATVTFDFAISEAVSVNTNAGIPTVTLSDGGIATFDAAASTSKNLVFETSVVSGQNSNDLRITGLVLNGSVPADVAGNVISVAGVSTQAGSDTGIIVDTSPVAGVTTKAGANGGTVFTTVANASNSVTATASGSDVVNSLGSDTVQAGGGSDIVYASGPAATVMGGVGNLTFVAGAGSYTAGGGAGVDILYGGNGPNVLTGGAGKTSIIVAGFGNTSLVGGAGSSGLMFGGFGASTFTGSTGGSDTLVGGAGANTFNMTNGDIAFGGPNGPDTYNTGSGSTLIVEGAGVSQIIVGSGLTTDFAGTGLDTYTIKEGTKGIANIIGFKAGDRITLAGGFTAADASSAASRATTGSFGTTLNLTDGTQVNLFGVSITASQISLG